MTPNISCTSPSPKCSSSFRKAAALFLTVALPGCATKYGGNFDRFTGNAPGSAAYPASTKTTNTFYIAQTIGAVPIFRRLSISEREKPDCRQEPNAPIGCALAGWAVCNGAKVICSYTSEMGDGVKSPEALFADRLSAIFAERSKSVRLIVQNGDARTIEWSTPPELLELACDVQSAARGLSRGYTIESVQLNPFSAQNSNYLPGPTAERGIPNYVWR